MRLPQDEPTIDGPNMTPVIDVVFLLLIFFLVATRFDQEEKEMPVQLPEVAQAQPISMNKYLTVNVTPEGKYVVALKEYGEAELVELLREVHRNNPHQSVLIRGDRNAAWKHGVRLMGLCNKAKIEYRVAALQES